MSDQDSDEKAQYEARLQRRLQILKKQFEAGKIKIAEGLQVAESLKRVRHSPDGTVDLNTVDGLVRSRRLRGTPIIDAPTSWQYFVWKLEYDAEKMERGSQLPDLHILRGLQSLADSDMEWLGKVPPEALIEIRKADALAEIRAVLAKGVSELALANPTNFYRTSDHIFDNIHAAFAEHKKNIEDLRSKKWKFAGTDMGSWFVVGSLAVTAAATGLPVWGFAAIAADQLLPAPKLKDIPKSIKELASESYKLRQSPVGMLFKYSRSKA